MITYLTQTKETNTCQYANHHTQACGYRTQWAKKQRHGDKQHHTICDGRKNLAPKRNSLMARFQAVFLEISKVINKTPKQENSQDRWQLPPC